jgi:hypothetical protein
MISPVKFWQREGVPGRSAAPGHEHPAGGSSTQWDGFAAQAQDQPDTTDEPPD